MARAYASVYLTIWNDPDFRDVSLTAQWLYFTMLTYPTLNSCGVMEWREAKLVRMTQGLTVQELREAAWELGQRRLIAVDPDTEEALVRSFVRHDGGLKSPNMAKGIVREHGAIASQKLMALVSQEVRRAVEEHPDWRGVEEVGPVAKQFMEPDWNPSDLVPIWFHLGSPNPSDLVPGGSDLVTTKKGEPFRFGFPPSPSPSPSPNGESDVRNEEPATTTKRRSPLVPIPADWTPTDLHAKKATSLGLNLETEVQMFQDSALAKDRRYADWNRAFSIWLTNARKFAERDGTLPKAVGAEDPWASIPWSGDDDE